MKEYEDTSRAVGVAGPSALASAVPAVGKHGLADGARDETHELRAKQASGSSKAVLNGLANLSATILGGIEASVDALAEAFFKPEQTVEDAIEALKELVPDCNLHQFQRAVDHATNAVFASWLRQASTQAGAMARAASDFASSDHGTAAANLFENAILAAGHAYITAMKDLHDRIRDISHALKKHEAMCGRLRPNHALTGTTVKGSGLHLQLDPRFTPFHSSSPFVSPAPGSGGVSLHLPGLEIPHLLPGAGARLPRGFHTSKGAVQLLVA